jgi:hypothetical protein
VFILALPAGAAGEDIDWPTYRHDVRRSGATPTALALPLRPLWTFDAGRPRQAWSGPAKWDAYVSHPNLQSMRNFDPCHHLTAGGGRVFFGSSTDDAAHALDAATGKPIWTHFTNGPVRLPPTVAGGLAWFGSDDGHVYCVDAATGALRWDKRAAPSDRLIPSNGKLISPWPVRTGVLVQNGKAWFAASLVPWEKSYIWCVDAATGDEASGGFLAEHRGIRLQGAMLAGGDLLYIPQGRAAPLAFKMADGSPAGSIGQAGGVTCVLTPDNRLLAGPQNQRSGGNQIRLTRLGEKKPIATIGGTNRVAVAGAVAYYQSAGHLVSTDLAAQPKPKNLWRVPEAEIPVELIVAGSHLILGLHDHIEIREASTGKLAATLQVDGAAYGLAVAEGCLFVSTDKGVIHAFGQ